MSGTIEILENNFSRAHLQRRNEFGVNEHIRGPRRGQKRRAEQDLEALRAAAAQAGPDATWSAMCAEGRRLRERADFEARVSAYVVNYTSAREPRDLAPVVESQSLEMEDTQPYESQEYYNDENELWQEIDEDGNLPDWQPSLPLPVAHPRDSVEATALQVSTGTRNCRGSEKTFGCSSRPRHHVGWRRLASHEDFDVCPQKLRGGDAGLAAPRGRCRKR